jgi:RNA polymerase sigma-70 factor (ECF subfamily)
VVVTLDVHFDTFDDIARKLFLFGIAHGLNISPALIDIVAIKPGSVKITLQLPSDAAGRLLKEANDPQSPIRRVFQDMVEVVSETGVPQSIQADKSEYNADLQAAARMEDRAAWLAAFLTGLDRSFSGDLATLKSLLVQQIATAQRNSPRVKLSPDVFAGALARKLEFEPDPLAELARLSVADLYLAIAVAVDAPGAVLAFEQQILSRVPIFLARTGAGAALIDEATQQLRIKLLVGSGAVPARINQYSGHGALESWVCAVAVRVMRNLQRAEARRKHAADSDALDVLVASDDPELELLLSRHQAEFSNALRATVQDLEPRQRTLLRLHFFERLATTEIGWLYRVNPAVSFRWLAEAREAVVSGVKRRLHGLGMTVSELDSLLDLMQSRLDVSFERLLADDETPSSS